MRVSFKTNARLMLIELLLSNPVSNPITLPLFNPPNSMGQAVYGVDLFQKIPLLCVQSIHEKWRNVKAQLTFGVEETTTVWGQPDQAAAQRR